MYDSGSDTRRACELHTHNLWQSHADANGDTDGHSDSYSYSHSYGNSYSNSHGYVDSNGHSYGNCDSNCDCDRSPAAYTHATASSDTAAPTVRLGDQ